MHTWNVSSLSYDGNRIEDIALEGAASRRLRGVVGGLIGALFAAGTTQIIKSILAVRRLRG